MARILITGATGSLGRRVTVRAIAGGHTVMGTYFREPGGLHRGAAGGVRADICDLAAVGAALDSFRPDFVVHTAAGRDRNDWAPTADGAAIVALACVGVRAGNARTEVHDRHGRTPGQPLAVDPAATDDRAGWPASDTAANTGRVRLVHVSSDAVFSGRAGREYTERDRPDPIYPYGAAKAAAETAVRAIDPAAAIVRTSLILGDGNGAHERLTHDLAAGRVGGALFVDEIRKPVHVDDLADALLELGLGEYAGVLNVAGKDAVSRYDLGLLVARRDGLDPARIPSATSSGRPGDIRLDISVATEVLNTRLRGAHEFMQAPGHQ